MLNMQNLIDAAKCDATGRHRRWPDGGTCPRCQGTEVTKQGREETDPYRQRDHCKRGERSFDDVTETIGAGPHQPLRGWILGLYVLGTFLRPWAHSHVPRTRITILVNGALWFYWRLSRLFGGTRVQPPQVFKDGYGTTSTFTVGAVHGLGAETPTQILLFLMAANLGGTGVGLLGLLMFIVGLVFMNTLLCASAAGLFSASLARPYALRALTLATSAYSIIVGAIFLLGSADRLPSLTG